MGLDWRRLRELFWGLKRWGREVLMGLVLGPDLWVRILLDRHWVLDSGDAIKEGKCGSGYRQGWASGRHVFGGL